MVRPGLASLCNGLRCSDHMRLDLATRPFRLIVDFIGLEVVMSNNSYYWDHLANIFKKQSAEVNLQEPLF